MSGRPTAEGPGLLWLAVYLPDLAVEVLVRGGLREELVAVVEGRGSRRRVSACGEAVRARGIHPGMTLAAACALVPTLRALERDPRAEARALARLAAWAGQFSSRLSLVPTRGLLLEVGGSLGLFGGLDEIGARVRRGLADLGYRGVLAAAPTPLGAWLLARGGGGEAVRDRACLGERLGRLPLAVAELPAEQCARLQGLGLRSLGDLLRLPRSGLARRLGGGVVDLLDRALGRAPDPREPYRPPRAFAARLALPVGVAEVEALLFPLRRLILELVGHLRALGGGVERVVIGLEHPRSPATRLTVGLAGPSRDERHLQTLVREHLQRVSLPAVVEAVALEARRIVDLDGRSLDLFAGAAPTGEGWGQLIDRLQARLGEEAVRGLAPVADHRPERAWRFTSAGATAGVGVAAARRPLWLLDPPRALAVRNDRPWWGGVLTLREGPERIEGGWWDGADVSRDYYVAENPAGERCWIFQARDTERRWFLHGVFG
jgi:protein ImuB